jgi:hypothetical protein
LIPNLSRKTKDTRSRVRTGNRGLPELLSMMNLLLTVLTALPYTEKQMIKVSKGVLENAFGELGFHKDSEEKVTGNCGDPRAQNGHRPPLRFQPLKKKEEKQEGA